MCRVINFQMLSLDRLATVTVRKVYDSHHLEICTFLLLTHIACTVVIIGGIYICGIVKGTNIIEDLKSSRILLFDYPDTLRLP